MLSLKRKRDEEHVVEEEKEDFNYLCKRWLGHFIFKNNDDDNEMQTYLEALDEEERVEYEKRQLVLAVLCYLFPLYDNLSIKNN